MSGFTQSVFRSLTALLPASPIIGGCHCFLRLRSLLPSSCSSTMAAFSTTQGGTNKDPPTAPTHASDHKNNRIRALSLYRQLLRGAERMPTPNRQNYVKRKTRLEFRKHTTLTDQEEIDFQLRLADTNLDTVLVQAEHLSRLFNDPDYQNYN
jgi:hypothetical protein